MQAWHAHVACIHGMHSLHKQMHPGTMAILEPMQTKTISDSGTPGSFAAPMKPRIEEAASNAPIRRNCFFGVSNIG